jgi:hypothetical protein
MKVALLTIVLATGSIASGQSNAGDPSRPDLFGKSPSARMSPERGFPALRVQPDFIPQWKIYLPPPRPANRLGDLSIDPRILIHPAQRNLGSQPPGVAVAQNQFPGLTLLPIDGQRPSPALKPIPITWPNLKTEPIPTACPQCGLVPVNASSPPSSAQK